MLTNNFTNCPSNDEDDLLFLPKRQKPGVLSESDSEVSTKTSIVSSKYCLKSLPKSVVKSPEDNVPLPDPFTLPKNYRPDVASALSTGKMTMETTRAFLSTVASAMFTYKRYPTNDDYSNVARTIITKYPFMKSPTGKPYVSPFHVLYTMLNVVLHAQGAIIVGLKNRFKERRRTKKPRPPKESDEALLKADKKKGPAINSLELPPIPAGEDATSFERHNRSLDLEYQKAKPNAAVVKELMQITFAMRRRVILSDQNAHDIQKYPFLQSPEHVSILCISVIMHVLILCMTYTKYSNINNNII